MKLAFYKGTPRGRRGWVSRLVRFAERGAYSHCEVVLSDGLCASSSRLDGGVRFKRIDFNPDHWDFVEPPESSAREETVRAWFEARQGAKYDHFGGLGVVFRPLRPSSDRWFCSEAAAAALGFPEPWRIGPNLLAALVREMK